MSVSRNSIRSWTVLAALSCSAPCCTWTAERPASEQHDAAGLDRDATEPGAARADACANNGTADAGLAQAHQLSVLTWNLEWFQDPNEGPSDDALQFAGVREILTAQHPTLIALEEVASEDAFDRLLSDLPGYAGTLSGYDWIQKTALLWDEQRFELRAARPISGFEDAGRPPLEVLLRARDDGHTLRVVVIHAKAQADAKSHEERVQLARGLKAHLDTHRGDALILLGDFNDRLLGSITSDADSPYRDFVNDAAYATPTLVLNQDDHTETSYVTGATVDHIVLSAALGRRVDASSINVLRGELLARYPRYSTTISDHFPVTLELR